MDPNKRGSRAMGTAILLTIAGGFLDSYTYFVRDGVFANAQTANIIKLAIAIAEGNRERYLFYLFPILAFAAGVWLSLYLEGKTENLPRRGVLLIEIGLMILISFLPTRTNLNIIANILVSFLTAMQMQAFQIFHRQGMATTVATGNLRKAVECLYNGIHEHDREQFKVSSKFFFILLVFTFGVYLGTIVSKQYGQQAILFPAILLALAFIYITIVSNRNKKSI